MVIEALKDELVLLWHTFKKNIYNVAKDFYLNKCFSFKLSIQTYTKHITVSK